MKQFILISIVALTMVACGGQNTPEAQQNKADNLRKRIIKLEKQLEQVESAALKNDEERTYPIKVIELQTQNLSREIEFSANLLPWEELNVATAQPGKISKIYVEIGDHVTKGQKLFQMDDTQLKQAKIQLESLRKDYERLKQLRETESISEQQYDQVKSQLEATESNVQFLEENVTLFAPFSGIITAKYFEDGEIYSGAPNTQTGKSAIVVLQQVSVLKATINVSEQYFNSLENGTSVTINADAIPDEVFTGTITNIHPTIDPLTRSFKVEIKIPNQGLQLRPGMFGRVKIKLDETEALVAPAIAVIQQEGTNNRYIFIHENGRAKRYNVQIGERFDDSIEIICDKINEGDELIVAGQAILMDNNKVKVTR